MFCNFTHTGLPFWQIEKSGNLPLFCLSSLIFKHLNYSISLFTKQMTSPIISDSSLKLVFLYLFFC
ncbi:hypothetical protein CKX96_09665 [Staphylococcus argenteus]|nr:hypothetical protein CJ017_06120 [Staphylococcus argenteus]ATZ87069.1 hypothetical protein CKO49_06140 [Staphylococcus argenteus]KAA0802436.1 hypothetical protein DVU64_01920 [Staphylococcus argenteus]MZG24740.1 hypothetical protein [Staphylococcus argenteus]PNY94987.1 hypothetical protein CD033_02390 [Staphylococcus argenteus]